MTRLLPFLALLFTAGSEVAFVDLTGPAKTPDLRTSAKTTVRGGGVLTEQRVSCGTDQNGNPMINTTVAGDNQAGIGATLLTWNLQ
jgi:hypothetical protein